MSSFCLKELELVKSAVVFLSMSLDALFASSFKRSFQESGSLSTCMNAKHSQAASSH